MRSDFYTRRQIGDTMINTIDDFDQHCLDNAVMFTAIRGRQPADRLRTEFPSLEEAKAFAAQYGDGRTLIYAVTKQGRSAPIASL